MINMHRAARHLAQYRFGYLLAGFLLIAALTFGVRLGAGLPQEELEGMSVALTGWGVIGLLLRETVCVAALMLAAMHPFGCGLCALLLVGKGAAVGYSWGWWMAKFGLSGILPFALMILPQGLLALGAWAYGASVSSYAALRILVPARRAYLRMLLTVWILQAIAVFLRCLGCAWAGA